MSGPVAQVLRDAAELIERDGWCQGGYFSAGRHCAKGALAWVAGTQGAYTAAYEALYRHTGWPSVAGWNDAPDRTVTEVLAALRACADEQEASDG